MKQRKYQPRDYYRVVYHEPGEGFTVDIPDLPGCYADGDTLEEAIENSFLAIRLWIASRKQAGLPIPSPGNHDSTDPRDERWRVRCDHCSNEYDIRIGFKHIHREEDPLLACDCTNSNFTLLYRADENRHPPKTRPRRRSPTRPGPRAREKRVPHSRAIS